MSDEIVLRAGELALGLLDEVEAQEAWHEVTVDPQMRAAYGAWIEELVTVYDSPVLAVPAEAPRPGPQVFANVEAALFGVPALPRGQRWRDWLRAPENRGLVVTMATAKLLLLAWILYLFL